LVCLGINLPAQSITVASGEQAGGSRIMHSPQTKSATLLTAADGFARLVVRLKITEETCS
jgi:hypothetical protein